ncbi:MAG: DNA mismatch repair protein MutS [Clostridiales bacterium]|nr:DNA mismatch repair protein MutS [Clostridiales bacterium]
MASLTPMMQQYLELKEKYSDCLLFFRLGDFYEMFFEDALTASRELEIVLTGRDCGLTERAPMCGVPYHSVNSYINKLIDKGYKVAICEQLEDPALAKGLVERDVIRVITPGTVIEEQMLPDNANNYIMAILAANGVFELAYCDVSTGDFYSAELIGDRAQQELMDELTRIEPREIIANEFLFTREFITRWITSKFYIEKKEQKYFDIERGQRGLMKHFKVNSLSGYGISDNSMAAACAGALLRYLEDTQKNALTHITKIMLQKPREYMGIDASTRRNLELTTPLRYDGSKKNTLLGVLDRTKTSMGARMMRNWVDQPLQSIEAINERLDAVEALYSKAKERGLLKDALDGVYDIERLCSRIAYGTVNARDCDALRKTLAKIPSVREAVERIQGSDRLGKIASGIDPMEDIRELLERAIVDEPPLSVKDGGIIKEGYDKEVDELKSLSHGGRSALASIENRERERTGIKNLKVGYNRVFGYYIEVTNSYRELVPLDYQRKQTLTNAERFVTPELKQLEEKILGAEEKCISLEYSLFCEIRELLLECIDRLKADSVMIAELDCFAALAQDAVDYDYCRPRMSKSGKIKIVDGRHPIVERSVKDQFIPNSTELDDKDDRIVILTGPNMAGKSTYMRQVALITLMAHMGSFVPAKQANICLVDKIFTRVGASDSLSTGQSTFMVEMSEMANILNNATSKSLLVIDEIGRGTSTFDGLSIAWAVVEHISDRRKCGAKTLFATHYHELTELEGKLDGVKNYRITVKEIGDDIIFLRRIMRGGADKSFGIQVARLAGLPYSLIERSKEILKQLEDSDINNAAARVKDVVSEQVNLLGSTDEKDIISELRSIDVNGLTPMEALSKLYELSMRAKI